MNRDISQPGWATTEGTAIYRKRFDGRIPPGHFRQQQELWLASIGIGTYLGDHDAATAAQTLGITVTCSASILQGQLSHNLPPIVGEVFSGLETDAQRSLQSVRSTPGATVALVGMKQLSHVEENLKVAQVPPVPWKQYAKLFKGS